MAAFLSN